MANGDGLHDAEGWLFRQELVDCGKGGTGRCRKCAEGPGHGPYWYRYRWYDGEMHKRYVGKTLPQSVVPVVGHAKPQRPAEVAGPDLAHRRLQIREP